MKDSASILGAQRANHTFCDHCISSSNSEKIKFICHILNIEYGVFSQPQISPQISSAEVWCKQIENDLLLCCKFRSSSWGEDQKSSIVQTFNLILDSLERIYVYNRKIIQLYRFFEDFGGNCQITDLKKLLLIKYILLNKKYSLEDHSCIEELIEKNEILFSDEEKYYLQQDYFNEFKVFSPHFRTLPKENAPTFGTQIIQFIVPFQCICPKEIIVNDSVAIKVEDIEADPFKDPFTEIATDFSIDYPIVPVFISDIYDASEAAYIQVKYQNVKIPSREDGARNIEDVREQEALLGRTVIHDKEKVIATLRKSFNEIKDVLKIYLSDITIDLFSNFKIQYFQNDIRNTICFEAYLLTNPNSYEKARNNYKATVCNALDSITAIRKIIADKIFFMSGRDMLDTLVRLLHDAVGNAIEYGGCRSYFSDMDGHPLSEPALQPFVYNQLRIPLHLMGITINREVVCCNGSLDFHCSATSSKGSALQIAVEMKKADHPHLIHGLEQQLPQYMQAENIRYGIFLIFWFKTKQYPYPSQYSNIEEMKIDLERKSPRHGKTIRIVVIDCTPHLFPSNPKSLCK